MGIELGPSSGAVRQCSEAPSELSHPFRPVTGQEVELLLLLLLLFLLLLFLLAVVMDFCFVFVFCGIFLFVVLWGLGFFVCLFLCFFFHFANWKFTIN